MPRNKRVFSRRTLFQRINERRGGPFILLFMAIAIIGGTGYALFWHIIPGIRSAVRPETNELPLALQSAQPYDDYSINSKEVLLKMGETRNIGMPVLDGGKIYFTAGKDKFNNPQLTKIYYRKVEDASSNTAFPAIKADIPWADKTDLEYGYKFLQNDNIIYVDVEGENIVYFDGKANGGGYICAVQQGEVYDEETGSYTEGYTATTLKEVFYGTPEVKLTGDCAIWMERTGKDTDKLYMMDITTGELTTLAVFRESPFGLSQPGVYTPRNGYGYVVWADYDAQYPDNTNFSTIKIRSIPYDESMSGEYPVDMYVHDPVTNGRVLAWTNGNEGANSTLFMSLDRGMPKMISENVSFHGLGDNFLAWCENGNIWAYFYEDDKKVRITRDSEMAMMVGVSENGIVWFDITEEGKYKMLDILKFALLED